MAIATISSISTASAPSSNRDLPAAAPADASGDSTALAASSNQVHVTA